MSKILWNVGPGPVVLDWSSPAIQPGDSHEFTDEQVDAGIAGDWSDKDPRSGLEAEKAFKQKRDAAPAASPTTEPAQAGEKE
jgi:hypothetical protein